MLLGLVAATLAVGALFVWWVSRPRILVRLAPGRVEFSRGTVPGGLKSDLRDVAAHIPPPGGRLEIRGRGPTLAVRIKGLDEGTAQRVRNVVLLRKERL